MGHKSQEGSSTGEFYERFDPDFLQDSMDATDLIIKEIDKHMTVRSLLSERRAKIENATTLTEDQSDNKLRVIEGGKP